MIDDVAASRAVEWLWELYEDEETRADLFVRTVLDHAACGGISRGDITALRNLLTEALNDGSN